jgi:hypothetical protein
MTPAAWSISGPERTRILATEIRGNAPKRRDKLLFGHVRELSALDEPVPPF